MIFNGAGNYGDMFVCGAKHVEMQLTVSML